jgi:hypothetical protein
MDFADVEVLLSAPGTGALEDMGGYEDNPTDFEASSALALVPTKGVGGFEDGGGYPDGSLGFNFD